jgi:hypothetical protein
VRPALHGSILDKSPLMCTSREATLAAEVRLLRDEVAAAQEAAATAAGNAKQFQALAQSSDQALATMQVAFHSVSVI